MTKLTKKSGDKLPTRIEVFRYNELIDEMRQKIESTLPVIQKLVDAYFQSPLDKTVNLQRIVYEFGEIEKKYFSDMLAANNPFPVESGISLKIGNLQLANDGDLKLLAEEARQAIDSNGLNLTYFNLNENKVSIDEVAFERYEDSRTIQADTPESVLLYLKLVELADAMEEVDLLLREKHNSCLFQVKSHVHPLPVARFFTLDPNNRLIVKPETFQVLKQHSDINAILEASV